MDAMSLHPQQDVLIAYVLKTGSLLQHCLQLW
jgi:hypothetical protein